MFLKFVESFWRQQSEEAELVHCQDADSRMRPQGLNLLQNLIII